MFAADAHAAPGPLQTSELPRGECLLDITHRESKPRTVEEILARVEEQTGKGGRKAFEQFLRNYLDRMEICRSAIIKCRLPFLSVSLCSSERLTGRRPDDHCPNNRRPSSKVRMLRTANE
jgi:hypothetical protein